MQREAAREHFRHFAEAQTPQDEARQLQPRLRNRVPLENLPLPSSQKTVHVRPAHRMPGWLRQQASVLWVSAILELLEYSAAALHDSATQSREPRCAVWNPHLQADKNYKASAVIALATLWEGHTAWDDMAGKQGTPCDDVVLTQPLRLYEMDLGGHGQRQ